METGGGQDLTEVCRFIEGILHPRQCMRRPSLRFGRNVTVWRSRAELQVKERKKLLFSERIKIRLRNTLLHQLRGREYLELRHRVSP
eukprot:scaffold71109_cov15-Tisochrysis_lutea.AAC.1